MENYTMLLQKNPVAGKLEAAMTKTGLIPRSILW
jgi:hypothetical protein